MPDVSEITQKQTRSVFQVILSSGFLAALSTSFVLYVNSSFLEMLVPKAHVGYVFAVAYVLTFVVMHNYSRLMQYVKNYVVLLWAFGLEVAALLVLAFNFGRWQSLIAFVIFVVLYNAVIINYDILIELISEASDTGRMRGMFWTAANMGILVGPFFSGMIIDRAGYSAAYLLAALTLVPAWLLIFFTYRKSAHNRYNRHRPLWSTAKKVLLSRDLFGIYLIAFILFFFYSWMVIYTPIHLLQIGFTWTQIGQMFTIMLLPFVLIEYPAGWLADNILGETEMLTLGLAIMGVSLVALVSATGFLSVMLILFCSRIGAALVEIMRDTYFYKLVDEQELDLIDLFRNMRSLAYIAGPMFGAILLSYGFPLVDLFMLLAGLMLLGTFIPVMMKDTL